MIPGSQIRMKDHLELFVRRERTFISVSYSLSRTQAWLNVFSSFLLRKVRIYYPNLCAEFYNGHIMSKINILMS